MAGGIFAVVRNGERTLAGKFFLFWSLFGGWCFKKWYRFDGRLSYVVVHTSDVRACSLMLFLA